MMKKNIIPTYKEIFALASRCWKLKCLFLLLFFPYFVIAQGNGLYEFIGNNGKHGFINATGKIVIPAKYIRTWHPGFSEGLAFVSEKQAPNGDYIWICIDTLGQNIFHLDKNCYPEESYSGGYAVIHKWSSGEYWFVDNSGKKVFDKSYGYACKFTNGLARVSDEKYGFSSSYFIDKDGKRVTQIPLGCSVFINGVSFCDRQLVDTLGNILIDNIHEWTGNEYEYLKVKRNGKWGFVDRKGNVIIDFQYEEDRRRAFDKSLKLNTDSLDALPKAKYRNVGFFHEGLASIQHDNLFGFINLKNEVIIEPIFKNVQYFSEGLAGATLDGIKWGFINTEGEFVIEPQYYFVDAFKNGICGVILNYSPMYMNDYCLDAIINKNNEVLYQAEMHSYMGFCGELIKYYDGGDFRGKIHYVDKNGKKVVPKSK